MAAIQNGLAVITATDDRSRAALAVLRRQITHMTRLVNDLLDVTRVRHGRLRLEPTAVEVNRAVLAAVETMRPQAQGKGLAVEWEPCPHPLVVRADPERLTQVLDNLLSNAVTYTDAGRITVSVRDESGLARIIVRDTGIGLDPAEAPSLFQPYQPKTEGQHRGGLGLGLSLVKALVEAHGGSIAVRSEGRGRGSEFTVSIPLATSLAEAEPSASIVPPPPRRVLAVDDQHDVADTFAALLEALGQKVHVAYDGEGALAIARTHHPEVAFLDVSMPDMTGAELARRLREALDGQSPVLVAVTGHDQMHAGVQAGEFDHHLLKPVTIETLAALLNGLPSGHG
jgi:CheY-like chemotaxis protein